MDPVLLARIQFGMTIGFHFLFPPITIGLAWFVFWLERRALRKADAEAGDFARFFGRIFAILYALGVASGVVMSLQFGTNWGAFSDFVNGVLGPLLVVEVIFTFFLETAFFGLWWFGRGRVSERLRVASIGLVAFGATLSGLVIVAAGSWMQTPAGFTVEGGRAVLSSFTAAFFNPSTIPRFVHVLASAATITGFFILGMAAMVWRRGLRRDYSRRIFALGATIALAGCLLSASSGVYEAIRLGGQQPEKVAIIRGVPPAGTAGAPEAFTAATVPAADALLPPAFPVASSFWAMAVLGIGMILLLLLALSLPRLKADNPIGSRRLFGFFAGLWWLPVLSTEAGWFTAEIGRQPWIVYKLMLTKDAVSVTVPAGAVLFSLLLIGAAYLLFLCVAWVLVRNSIDAPFGADTAPAGTAGKGAAS